jgi:K+-sensing histidine kinase KdpD
LDRARSTRGVPLQRPRSGPAARDAKCHRHTTQLRLDRARGASSLSLQMRATGLPAPRTSVPGPERGAKSSCFSAALSALARDLSRLCRAANSPRNSATPGLNFPTSSYPNDDVSKDASVRFIGAILAPAAKSLLLVALATLVIFVLRSALSVINLATIIYLLPVLIAALRWGTWPALLAAVGGALAADFFFYPPFYSFWISDTQNIADLLVFLLVALVSGNLAGDLRRREREINELYEFSKRLAACLTTADMINATQDYLSKALGRPAKLIARRMTDGDTAGDGAIPEIVRRQAAVLHSQGEAITVFDKEIMPHAWHVRPVSFGDAEYLVFVDLGIRAIGARPVLDRRIDAVLKEATDNLMRLDLAKAIDDLQLHAQSDTLKSALVATMSHDLRSPLVSILGAASVLEQMAEVSGDARTQSLAATVHDEAARLDSDIKNLIDAARITAGAQQPNLEMNDPVDIVRAAIRQKRPHLAGRQVEVGLAPDLPLVRVQSGLIENAIAQLLDNATKYSPPGSKIRITGRADQDWVILSISDQGAGLTMAEQENVGLRSFRGKRHLAIRGSGLGLWLANTFVTANGGRLNAESAGPGLGTTIHVSLRRAQ